MKVFEKRDYEIAFLVGRKQPKTGGERSNHAIFSYLKKKFNKVRFVSAEDLPFFIKVFAGRANLIYFFLSNIFFLFSKSLLSNILLIDFYMHPHLILLTLFKKKQSRWIVIVRDAYHKSTNSFFWANRLLQTRFLRRMNILVFNSYTMLNYYHQFIPNLPESSVVYPGFGKMNRALVKKREKRCREKQFQLLYVGSIRLKKGMHFLIEALSYLNFSNWKLVLAGDYLGDPIYFARLKDILKRSNFDSNKIKFTGHLDRKRLAALYLDADVFIFPSLFEPYGQVIFEAASFSLPIACSRTGALPEIIPEECALFFNPENSREIARCIEQLYHVPELMEHLSKNSQKILYRAVTREEMAINFYKIISELIGH